MSISKQLTSAIAVGVALTLSVPTSSQAQTDTTRRAVSEQRIPVRKDQAVVREARGEVALSAEVARINDLESKAAALQARIETLEASNARLTTRTDEMGWMLASLKDSLRFVNGELATARAEFNARAAALSDSVQLLNGRLTSLRYGSLFGHSGFYLGLGSGVNFTTGTFHDIGYRSAPNVVVPIGWSKADYPLGFRAEFAAQTFEGGIVPGFALRDPVAYSASAMATLNFPINTAKSHFFYVMGGGGIYRFDRIGATSTLSDKLDAADNATKFGVLGGAGFEFHVLGATSLFVQSAFTNIFGEKGTLTTGGKNLQWIPLTAGVLLR